MLLLVISLTEDLSDWNSLKDIYFILDPSLLYSTEPFFFTLRFFESLISRGVWLLFNT